MAEPDEQTLAWRSLQVAKDVKHVVCVQLQQTAQALSLCSERELVFDPPTLSLVEVRELFLERRIACHGTKPIIAGPCRNVRLGNSSPPSPPQAVSSRASAAMALAEAYGPGVRVTAARPLTRGSSQGWPTRHGSRGRAFRLMTSPRASSSMMGSGSDALGQKRACAPGAGRTHQPLMSLRYLIRVGMSASAPRRRCRSAS